MRHGSVTKAVMSAVVLVGLVVGVPAALWLVAGSPVPGGLPSMGEVRSTLSSPDYTGTVLMGVLKVVGWVAWATFAWATLAELVAQARHRAAPRLRGLGFQQQVAGVLVAAVFAGFAWQAAASSSAVVGLPPPAAPVVQVVAPADPVAPVQRHAAAPTDQVQAGATATHTVVKGDTFWGLAAKYLGDGTRWREVYGLNDGREMPGGHTLCDPGWLEPGWELLVPAPDEAPGVEHTRTVVRGDTLSQIALEELGDASRYPELFDASAATVQPDGRQLSNPDLIYPGWQVTVPGTVGAKTPPQTPTAPPPAGQPPVDQSQQTTPAGGPGEQGTVVQQPRRQEAPPNTTAEGQAGAQAPDRWAPWVLVGLTGGGTVLAGSVWLALRARRQARSRHRRPGMALPAPGALLAPVEKTVVTVGPGMAPLVQYVDQVLRRLGAATAAGGGLMPDLVA
ncbi:MAG: LysM peptidoglycan-binding domain-containing protein, partial [Micrococcales bacterium]|nr:LysM peptidoglycan-binding domain-containing protein [Micrococcales bacterium]